MSTFERGSEWRRWDLHFHTPSSYDYGDKSVTDEQIIEGMKTNKVDCFAVTDHHLIDVQRYKNLKTLGETKGITVLPGIEFLSDARGKEPIHFIAVFSEDSNIDYIWEQIKNLTAIKDIYGLDKKPNEVYCDLLDTINLVKELGGIVTIHAGAKHGSIEAITNSLPHEVAQKKDIADNVDVFELGKETDQGVYRNMVFPAIGKILPMIICSDNHNIHKYHVKQNLWIKGSPDFNGLKYALTEPDERFYIGDTPDVISRVSQNLTKYIDSVSINLDGRKDSENVWFENIKIPLNCELVTIIGNKGSGKSALADIIGLCCDAEHSDDYLFLTKKKFLQKGLGERFDAQVDFKSGFIAGPKKLNSQIDPTSQPLVRYLPQTYFEAICNEIGKTEAFREEIEKVVFQYVPTEKRMEKGNFTDLVNFKRGAVDREISMLIEEISELNAEIINLEDKTNPEYKEKLKNQLVVKQNELETHKKNKPSEVEDPSKKEGDQASKQKRERIDFLSKELEQYEKEVEICKQSAARISVDIEKIQNLQRNIKAKTQDIKEYIQTNSEIAQKLGIDLNQAITFKVDEDVFSKKIHELQQQVNKHSKSLSVDQEKIKNNPDPSSLTLQEKIEVHKQKIAELNSQLTFEYKHYQKYIQALSDWNKVLSEIEGSEQKEGSLKYLQKQISYIETELPTALARTRELRLEKSLEIYSKKSEVKSVYDEVKQQIDEVLNDSNGTGLTIASAFYAEQEFTENLLRNIMQNRVGTFYGSEGKSFLKENILSQIDWDSADSVREFLSNMIDSLEYDLRDPKKHQPTFIGSTVKDRRDLYRYLFSLEFLEPFYDLRQNRKSLDTLSPGEKGALLLVFYLVLDNEDIPLLIDQPEDNLDNNSVAQVLVPFIRTAKKKRQIIMVTHNPNLAVVADSEQVIRVSIDKEAGNTFEYISGGIEEPRVRDAIVDVLEGTMPAFSLRHNKYSSA